MEVNWTMKSVRLWLVTALASLVLTGAGLIGLAQSTATVASTTTQTTTTSNTMPWQS